MNPRKWKSSSNEFMIFIKKHEKGKRLAVLEEPFVRRLIVESKTSR